MADWDIVIVGGGAAGLSAAAAIGGSGKSCLILDRMGGGGELMNLGPLVDVGEDVSGPDLAARLLEDAIGAGATLEVAEVTGITAEGAIWRIATDGDAHTAHAVILATGLTLGTLDLDGEAEWEGRGLSHCATCDGPLFRGEPVVVAGSGRWARLEAEYLATMAKVTLVTQGGRLPEMENVTVIDGRIVALNGTSGLDSVSIRSGNGANVGVPAQGVFVQTGRRGATEIAPAALACGSDITTNMPGLFVAGDVRDGAPHTLAAAMEDGRRAAAAILTGPLGNNPA